ncbi:N-formylglutamate amidohydrolase [Actinoplanes sp. URMC 104]|uniref:N-formylglutamate amidohydrolase n=1 Tax=Actinoplanes sp. URMC 104 TaxID=3423409 RepID=UPI003F1B75F7
MTFQIAPGDPASPVILHVPHASRELTPGARAGILLDDAALTAELDNLTDAHTDLIAARAAGRAWVFTNTLSRLVVDPERFPDDREEMRAVGMGAVYTHGHARRRLRADDPARDAQLIRDHFTPYAAAMTGLVADRLSATGRAVVLDVHSYPTVPLPYELHGDTPRPQICLGADPAHAPASLLGAARSAFAAFSVDVNTPFSGAYVPLDFYGHTAAVTALMVEIRRDTYMTEPGGDPHDGLDAVVEGLAALVEAVHA